MYQTIVVEKRENVGVITLNRPHVRNAFDVESYAEIRDVVRAFTRDEDVGALLITGNGPHFSAGGDIKRFKKQINEGVYLRESNVLDAGDMAIAVRQCPKPVVAAINGAALGAGGALALACDFRIMTPKSMFGFGFVNLGLSGDTCSLYLLQKLVGTAKAGELMMTGGKAYGVQAMQMGLATQVVNEDQLEEESFAYAKNLAGSPLFAIARQKALINRFFYSDIEEYKKIECEYMCECSRTLDFAEAVNAFLEKRKPVFCGK